MFGKTSLKKASQAIVVVSLAAVLAGCSTSDPGDLPNPIGASKGNRPAENPLRFQRAARAGGTPGSTAPVVQAYCPQVVIRTDTGFHRAYAGKAAEGDDSKLLYQASFADVTRSCTASETTLTINVMAQGRIVAGAAGKTGDVTLPVLVEVADGDNVIYSQRVPFTANIPPEGSGQFIFQKPDVAIPNAVGGASRFTTVRIGFDTGKAAPKKPARRG